MAFAEENPVVTELFGALGAPVNLVDVFDAAVKAMETEFHKLGNRHRATGNSKNTKKFGKAFVDQRENSTNPQPVAHGITGS
jgi:hypothetical protein